MGPVVEAIIETEKNKRNTSLIPSNLDSLLKYFVLALPRLAFIFIKINFFNRTSINNSYADSFYINKSETKIFGLRLNRKNILIYYSYMEKDAFVR